MLIFKEELVNFQNKQLFKFTAIEEYRQGNKIDVTASVCLKYLVADEKM